jgi:hypothetical protein
MNHFTSRNAHIMSRNSISLRFLPLGVLFLKCPQSDDRWHRFSRNGTRQASVMNGDRSKGARGWRKIRASPINRAWLLMGSSGWGTWGCPSIWQERQIMREVFLTTAANTVPGERSVSHKFNSYCVNSFRLIKLRHTSSPTTEPNSRSHNFYTSPHDWSTASFWNTVC